MKYIYTVHHFGNETGMAFATSGLLCLVSARLKRIWSNIERRKGGKQKGWKERGKRKE